MKKTGIINPLLFVRPFDGHNDRKQINSLFF